MKKFVLNNMNAWRLGLALYQIAGGIAMLLVVFLNVRPLTIGIFILLSPVIGLSIASLAAGIAHFTKNDLRFFVLSKINCCAQVLQLSVPGFGFVYYYGPYLSMGFSGEPKFVMRFQSLAANFVVRFGMSEEYFVVFNALPIFLLIVLRWLERNPAPVELENAFLEEEPEA